MDTRSLFPDEVVVMILRNLSKDDLKNAGLVSKQWQGCANTVRYQQSLQQQLQVLGQSELWHDLNAIVHDQDISPYLKAHQFIRVRPGQSESMTLTAFYRLLKSHFPNRNHVFSSENASIITPDDLQKKARFISEEVAQYHPPTDHRTHQTLADFLRFPEEHQIRQREVFKAYQAIESSFTVMHMMIELWQRAGGNNALHPALIVNPLIMNVAIDIVCDPTLNRLLSAKGLVLLNDLYPPGLISIPCLIESCIKRVVQDHQTPSQATQAINHILSHMQEEDWLAYLTIPGATFELFEDLRLQALMSAIEINHPVILAHCTEVVARRIMKINISYDTCVLIFKSPIMTSHLSDDCLIEFLSKITTEELEAVLTANPALIDRLNFESVKALLVQPQPSEYINILLMQASFLNKLNREEIPQIAKFLLERDARILLQSPAFLNKLDQIAEQYGELARNDFLVSLAEHESFAFSRALVEDDHIFSMLTDEALDRIAQLCILASNALAIRRKQSQKNPPAPTTTSLPAHSAPSTQSQSQQGLSPSTHTTYTTPTAPSTTTRTARAASPIANTMSDDSSDDVDFSDSDDEVFDGLLLAVRAAAITPYREPDVDDDLPPIRSRVLLIIALLCLSIGIAGIGLGIAGCIGMLSAPLSITLLAIGIACVLGSACMLIIDYCKSRTTTSIAPPASSSAASILSALHQTPPIQSERMQHPAIEDAPVRDNQLTCSTIIATHPAMPQDDVAMSTANRRSLGVSACI